MKRNDIMAIILDGKQVALTLREKVKKETEILAEKYAVCKKKINRN